MSFLHRLLSFTCSAKLVSSLTASNWRLFFSLARLWVVDVKLENTLKKRGMILRLRFDNYALWLLLCLVGELGVGRGRKKEWFPLNGRMHSKENLLLMLIAENFHFVEGKLFSDAHRLQITRCILLMENWMLLFIPLTIREFVIERWNYVRCVSRAFRSSNVIMRF